MASGRTSAWLCLSIISTFGIIAIRAQQESIFIRPVFLDGNSTGSDAARQGPDSTLALMGSADSRSSVMAVMPTFDVFTSSPEGQALMAQSQAREHESEDDTCHSHAISPEEVCCNCASFEALPPKNPKRFNRTASRRPVWRKPRIDNSTITLANETAPGNGTGFATKFVRGFSQNGITYNGGPVMSGNTRVHLIWYGQWSSGGKQIIRDLINGLSNSDIQGIQTTYGDSNGLSVKKTIAAGSEFSFSSNIKGNNLDGNAVVDLVVRAAPSLPISGDDIYLVLTGPEVTQTNGKDAFCKSYCGWHTWNTFSNGVRFKYSWVGNPASLCGGSCGGNNPSPNGDFGVDAMASVIAHEIWEAQSDPELNAWGDSQGENADKCAWKFVGSQKAPNGAQYNVQLGARKFLLQSNWVNQKSGSCGISAGSSSGGQQVFTPWNDAVNAIYLDRHTASCASGTLMSQFQFQTQNSGKTMMRLGNTCGPSAKGVGAATRFTTPANDDGGGNAMYLDRHTVACPNNQALQQWHMFRPSARQISFEYWCAPATGGLPTCTSHNTASNDDGGGRVIFLDRHNVQCPSGKFLSAWKLSRTSTTQYRIDYRCCGV